MGVFPKLRIVHTDSFVEGQIFIPSVNYILMVLCIAVIAGYGGNNDRLGDAYGELGRGGDGGDWEKGGQGPRCSSSQSGTL